MKKFKVTIVDGRLNVEETKEEIVSYETMKDFIGGWIELPRRPIGDQWFDFVIDEEGRLKDLPINVVFVDRKRNVIENLVGPVMIVQRDNEGNSLYLTEEEVKHLNQYIETFLGPFREVAVVETLQK